MSVKRTLVRKDEIDALFYENEIFWRSIELKSQHQEIGSLLADYGTVALDEEGDCDFNISSIRSDARLFIISLQLRKFLHGNQLSNIIIDLCNTFPETPIALDGQLTWGHPFMAFIYKYEIKYYTKASDVRSLSL